MIPVVALVGRPNVGKSSLFNCLTKSKQAIVADLPGLTRDRQYGQGKVGPKPFIVIDTGGLGYGEEVLQEKMQAQAHTAIAAADVLLFLVDAKAGLTVQDEALAKELRYFNKPIVCVVNKTDGMDESVASAEFAVLGFSTVQPISATHRRGINALMAHALAPFPEEPAPEMAEDRIKLAVVGRPNVGKSTLINRLLGEERVVVADLPGTTRDSVYIPFNRQGDAFVLIDTAGVRRRARVTEGLERFSVAQSLQAIQQAHVVLLVLDAREGITEQDLHLLGYVIETGKSLVIVVNKWDGLSPDNRLQVKDALNRRLTFVDYAMRHTISALHGTGVGDILDFVVTAYQSAFVSMNTRQLTEILQQAVLAHAPPMVRGRRIKLRYAHAGGHNPPRIVIHGNQTEALPKSYQTYLMRCFRQALALTGTPIQLILKSGSNPYRHQRNQLSPRQEKKRRRLLRHVKRKKH